MIKRNIRTVEIRMVYNSLKNSWRQNSFSSDFGIKPNCLEI